MKSLPARFTRRLALVALPLVAAALTARATTVIPPDFDHLLSRAQVSFEGDVTPIQSQWLGAGAENPCTPSVHPKVAVTPHGRAVNRHQTQALGQLAGGLSFDEVAAEYGVTRQDILAALSYAAGLLEDEEIRAMP